MQHLRTTHLRIVLHYHIYPKGPQTEAQLDLLSRLYTAGERDLTREVAHFFSSMSCLQYLFLATCGYVTFWNEKRVDTCRRLLSQGWRAVDSAADATLYPSAGESADLERGPCTAISSETGDAVMDQEELRFGKKEEVSRFDKCFCVSYGC